MFNRLKEIYNGKKVFLTGHTGFKGAWLLKTLSLLGAEVKGYALLPQYKNNLYNLIDGDHLCQSVIGDLRDDKLVKQELLNFEPDFIFHLAAQPLVKLSYQIPSETFMVNSIGTAFLLDAVRCLNKPCNIILITTDKVYHNEEWAYPYRETDRLGGYDPYSASKACTELVISSYRNSFFNLSKFDEHQKAISVARAGNVIGGGDWADNRLIPDIIRSLMEEIPVEIRNPYAVRPWQHVLEPLLGYLLLGKKLVEDPLKFSQSYNFGPNSNDALPVSEMVKLAVQAWGSGTYNLNSITNSDHEAGLLKLDISKAQAELSWEPRMNANKAVEITIEWYKKFAIEPININNFTQNQIYQFFELSDSYYGNT